MRAFPIRVVLLAFLAVACHNDDGVIGPASLLYQRWHLFQVRNGSDSVWISYDTDAYYDTEYRPDSTIVYRRDGIIVQGGCCAPTTFNYQKPIINYTSSNTCPNVRCTALRSVIITQLTESLLEINEEERILQYRAVRY